MLVVFLSCSFLPTLRSWFMSLTRLNISFPNLPRVDTDLVADLCWHVSVRWVHRCLESRWWISWTFPVHCLQLLSSREPLILLSTQVYISLNDQSLDTQISCTSFWWWGGDSCGFLQWDTMHLLSVQKQKVGFRFCPMIPSSSSSVSSSLYLSFHPSSLAGGLSQSRWVTLVCIYRVK